MVFLLRGHYGHVYNTHPTHPWASTDYHPDRGRRHRCGPTGL